MATESQENKDKPVKTVTLDFPYKFGTKEITECIFPVRPKAKALKGMSVTNPTADDQMIILGRVTNLSTPEIEDMDLQDFKKVNEVLQDFL